MCSSTKGIEGSLVYILQRKWNSPSFLDTSESSNDNTNVVNAPQEPFVVKQDPGGHYGYNYPPKVSIIPNLEPCNNQTIDELPQTLPSFDPTCYSGDGNSFTYDSKSNLVDDSPNIFNPPQQLPTYSYEFCGNDAYYGHNCPLQEKILEIEHAFEDKHCQSEDILELFRRLHNDVQNIHEELAVYINTLSWDRPTICYNHDDDEECTIAITSILSTEELDNSLIMGDEHLDTISETELDEVIKSSVENLVPIPSESEGIPNNMYDVPFHDNSPPLDILKDQFKDFSDSNDDSTSIDDDSFSIDDIEYVVIPEVGGIDADILLTIKDDIFRKKLLNVNLLIAKIKSLKDNPTLYSDFMTKSSSTSFNFLLEETNTFHNSLPASKTFCFDSKENSSGSTTTRADISLPDYESFYDDHVKEISSGSTTTHSDFSLYDSFIFDLLINPFPPADRSDFYVFVDELAHIISPPEYDCFSFKNEPNSGDFTMDVVEDIFPTREPRVHVPNVLPTHPTLQLNLDFILFSEFLFSYVVWIFLLFLSYSIAPQYLLSFGNENTIFDLGISIYHSFMPDVSHRNSSTFDALKDHSEILSDSNDDDTLSDDDAFEDIDPFEELSDIGSPRADDHEYLMLPEMLKDPYVEVALQAPPSPDFMPGPEEPAQAPPSPDYDEEDDEMDVEADEEEEEEEEHPALADSVLVAPIVADQAPSAEETEPFETDESVATPPLHPAYRTTARISIPAPVPMPAWTDSEVARLLAISSPPASPLSLWSSPPPHIPFPPLPSILSPPSPILAPVNSKKK
nr:hypothetical protein [Tanacetum cinerariifolium]